MVGNVESRELGSASRALQQTGLKLRAVLENSSVVLVAFDADGTIDSAQGRDIPTIGLPRDVIGMTLRSLTARAPEVATSVRKALAGESSDALLTVGDMHFDFRCLPTWNENGQVEGVLGIASNVTRDVQARLQSGERETRWQSLVSQSADVALIADITSTALTYVSPAVTRLFGWKPEELIGRIGMSLVHPDDVDRITHAVSAIKLDSSIHVTIEFRFECADGSYCWVEETISNLSAVPGVHGLVGNMRDITKRRSAVDALRQRDRLMRALAAKAADIALVVSRNGRVIYSNPGAATSVFVAAEGDTLDFANFSYIHPDDRPSVRQVMTGALIPGSSAHATYRRQAVDGGWRWVEQIVTNCTDDPDIGGLIVNIRDITDRVDAEHALRASEHRYRLIAETAQEGIWATDPRGQTLYANQKMADLLGCSAADFHTRPSWELISWGTEDGFLRHLRRREARGSDRFELTHVRPDGSERILRASVSPLVEDGQELGSLAMISDVTEARAAEEELRHRALHDPLTGLANRNLLIERLSEALDRSAEHTDSTVSLLVADIDQFKLVNDSFGHAAGDELLQEVARRWRDALSQQHLLARLGGDEFVVICDSFDVTAAHRVAEQLLTSLRAPIDLSGRAVTVSASIGIAVSVAASKDSAHTLLANADAAMYEAKSQGRGRVAVFTPALADRARHRLELFNDLKVALERDELTLRYQPVIELTTGRLLGVEGLCRWTHAKRGHVAPDEFIPLAEETGLIDALDRWVLGQACRDAMAMRRAGTLPLDGYIAVNTSAAHLAQPGFESAVCGILEQSGLPATALVLEVTESAVMRDPDASQVVLENLRRMGVAVAIDDFGTGYSSLGYLRRFPVSTLKIDRSFTQLIAEKAEDRKIVATIIDLAGALEVGVIAEGVETLAQLTLLRQLGCRAGQGFLWSPAVSPHELELLVQDLPGGRFPVEPLTQARPPLPRTRTSQRTGQV